MATCTIAQFAALSVALLLVDHASASGERQRVPSCLAGVCVGERAPTESALKSRFGGQSFDLGYRTRGYCYEQRHNEQMAQILFALKNFGDGWRVVAVRAAARSICPKTTPLKQPLQLKTAEGVALGGSVESVRAAYGMAAHVLEPRSKVIAEIMASQTQGIDLALQYVPADPSRALSAVFVLAGDRVVAIEVSSDV